MRRRSSISKIAFVWYLQRELGYVHKMFRGVARPDALPDNVHGWGIEKPWIAAVDNSQSAVTARR